jgi:hypothetical protein
MVVDAGGGDVGVAKPFLGLGDIRLIVEGVGGGRGAQGMRADRETKAG